ncbi:hypothetical protein CC86DRAFT_466185 [Ophiobolus disseminans]|uniref:Uncharacterized protein n=1 Tax=Ophiobolus disseminans TaxID=1469910 RepID=A0A6A7A414_9PLEO|nr:hypothetical protein CC86DRAFT_466185 [Ophiobolus disseminans]
MRRNGRYTDLDDEDTANGNNHEERSSNHDLWGSPQYDQAGGNRLKRFYLRALVGVLGPIDICAYYIAIWRIYLTPNGSREPLLFGPRGAAWVFYSWFVTGVLGLALSLHSLSGVEAGMLMEPAWDVGDATRLMLHSDKIWSGPGGWMRTIKWAVGSRGSSLRRSPSRLWFVFTLPSLLVFIAWSLSGLTMEITQGYCRAHISVPATMTGFSYDMFNEREGDNTYSPATQMWTSGQDMKVPAAGVVYTPEGYDRLKLAFLNQVPAMLPQDDGIPEIFLTAQADHPIEERNWGLLLQYKCTIINHAQDFRMINTSNRALHDYNRLNEGASAVLLDQDSTYLVWMNQTQGKWAANLDAAIESGLEVRSGFDIPTQKSSNLTNQCYIKDQENGTADCPGIHQYRDFEIALWQTLLESTNRMWFEDFHITYNLSIDHNLTEYFDAQAAQVFYSMSWKPAPLHVTAIGVQCRASSSVGSADINGIRSNYSNFQRTDTPIPEPSSGCPRRFGSSTPLYMMGVSGDDEWVARVFKASGTPPPYYATKFLENGAHSSLLLQLNFLQAEHLRRSMLRAYASYAMQLMYNGGQAYTTRNGSNLTFINPNATAFVPGPIIKPGVMPAAVPVTLFCIWALVSSALGIMYGFQRCWTETLDGHTMFRMGAELSDQECKALLKTSNTIEKEDRVALDTIPALVSNTKPETWLGRIGLVKGVKADKKKMYE